MVDKTYFLVNHRYMKTLRAYLRTLTPSQQADYAVRAGTTIGYLRKALSVRPRLDGALVRRLDEESNGEVSRYDLRPDIFGCAPPSGGNPDTFQGTFR